MRRVRRYYYFAIMPSWFMVELMMAIVIVMVGRARGRWLGVRCSLAVGDRLPRVRMSQTGFHVAGI